MVDHQPAEATRFPSQGSGRPLPELRTATKQSSAGLEPTAVLIPLVHDYVTLTTRPRALKLLRVLLNLYQKHNTCDGT